MVAELPAGVLRSCARAVASVSTDVLGFRRGLKDFGFRVWGSSASRPGESSGSSGVSGTPRAEQPTRSVLPVQISIGAAGLVLKVHPGNTYGSRV